MNTAAVAGFLSNFGATFYFPQPVDLSSLLLNQKRFAESMSGMPGGRKPRMHAHHYKAIQRH